MDAITPKYSKERYNTIVEHVRSFLQKIGFDPAFVTISGLDGDIDPCGGVPACPTPARGRRLPQRGAHSARDDKIPGKKGFVPWT